MKRTFIRDAFLSLIWTIFLLLFQDYFVYVCVLLFESLIHIGLNF